MLTYLYRESAAAGTLAQFYQNMNSILKLKMYKMQLLDNRHLLVKYVNMDVNKLYQKHPTTTTSTLAPTRLIIVQPATTSASTTARSSSQPPTLVNNNNIDG
jgi:de-etiolated-1